MNATGVLGAWRRVAPDRVSAAALLLALLLLALAIPPVLRWAVLDATFAGPACDGRGACWPFVAERLPQFLYGYYPAPLRWRLHLGGLALLAWCGLFAIPGFRRRVALATGTLVATLALGYALAAGGLLGLQPVEAGLWGGLFVTLLLSFTAMAVSLPAGIALALARAARNPVLRGLASAFVEIIRGVPLLAILFMAVVLLPLFLPWQGGIGLFARVVVGLCLYASAYMAEAVRGALDTLPQGQFDAAAALGLGYRRATRLVILPQVVRRAIPNIINIFIQILKDSTLVLIVGVYDLLGMVQLAVSDPKWLGHATEGFAFAGLVFFAICFAISRLSLRIERLMSAGEERMA
ncbi:MAG: amino acid ABC transporter permease [Alphaproteobacteria bacterium]|nr:amino acid ABC transporter permease [Alphaproteobacteria bacterium]